MNKMLNAALWYQKNGFSVIPAKKDKRPFIKWQPFQDSPADAVQIKQWWEKWPNANIAIVTGEKSNLTVLDADSEAGRDALNEFLPDSISIPTVKTPKGWHYYFKYLSTISNGVRVLTDCDVRSEGGYVIAPPSSNGHKKAYVWLDGLKISDVDPNPIPQFLADILIQGGGTDKHNINALDPLVYAQPISDSKTLPITSITNHNKHNNLLAKGNRDNDLFHVANCLVKGGMRTVLIQKYLEILANCCSPPFSEKEVPLKIQSALNRASQRDKISMQELRDWVSITTGNFSITNATQDITIITKEGKQKLRVYLGRLVNEGIIERVGNKDGWFRKIENEAPKIDILKASAEYVDLKLPLSLREYYRPMQKNLIIVAGTQDVGKTTFMLNIAKMNMNQGMEIRYCTSEMGGSELRSRLELFEPTVPLKDWVNIDFRERATNFQDMILPDGLNLIDYLEISDSFYQIGSFLTEIHNRLNKGIAVIALQKDFKSDLGRGGTFSLEKPRLYLSLTANPPEGNIAKIVKCKNWARQDMNPNHRECIFKVIKGCEIRSLIGWGLPAKMLKEVK